MTSTIKYASDDSITFTEYQSILQTSGLAERRPKEPCRLEKMLQNSNFNVTARNEEGKLVGLARCITDFGHTCYVCDLATSREVQGKGVGKCLMERTKKDLGPEALILLLSAPKAESFYEHIGMERSKRAFTFDREI